MRFSLLPVAVGIGVLIALTACTDRATIPFQLEFALRSTHFEECGSGAGFLGFYVSDVRATDAAGTRVPLDMDTRGTWQDGHTALVSLASDCASASGHEGNATVTGRLPAGDLREFVSVEFDLGVPFERNHANPLQAEPPLNLPSMFWTWQTGYKFLRLDLGDRWAFHLGSTRCVSASAVRPPAQACGRPNASRVRLPMSAALRAPIVVDVDALLKDIDVARHPPCTDRYAERESCGLLLEALGLDPVTGDCADNCAGQTVFRVSDGGP